MKRSRFTEEHIIGVVACVVVLASAMTVLVLKRKRRKLTVVVTPLTTTGIVMPPSFSTPEYERIFARALKAYSGNAGFSHIAGAFNALSYRFRAAYDAALGFQEQFEREGSSPTPEPRYEQERLLFDCLSSCFSVLEAYFFALFAIASNINPSGFPLDTPRAEKNVTPENTITLIKKYFPNDPIVTALQSMIKGTAYISLRQARNVLTHRTAPGRMLYVSTCSNDAPATEWKLDGNPITKDMLLTRTAELANLLQDAMVALDKFTKAHCE